MVFVLVVGGEEERGFGGGEEVGVDFGADFYRTVGMR